MSAFRSMCLPRELLTFFPLTIVQEQWFYYRGGLNTSAFCEVLVKKRTKPFEDTGANMGSKTLLVFCCKVHLSELGSVVMCYGAMPSSYLQGCRPAAFLDTQLHFGRLPHNISLKVLLLSLRLFVGCICLCLNPFPTYCLFSTLMIHNDHPNLFMVWLEAGVTYRLQYKLC